jgi:type I restriction-modification system DNA methylase subunit
LPHEDIAQAAKRLRRAGSSRLENLENRTLVGIIEKLAKISLTRTQTDMLGLAFSLFFSDRSKQWGGQFFTPREIVDFVAAYMRPQPG